jgi:pyruvate formate lyase activating enzyme
MPVGINDKSIQALASNGAIRPVPLCDQVDGRLRCGVCQRRCFIKEGGVGFCGTVVNLNSCLNTTIYGVISSAAADPIEKKPVYHFKPGSLCYSVGSLGCNFRCKFCQNFEIAYDSPLESDRACRMGFGPDDLVNAARQGGCEGVAWTYNEPSIWLNYTLDCAKACKAAGLYTGYVTNGFATMEGLDLIGPYLDVYRVDIKSLDDKFYQELIGVAGVSGILEVAERAKVEWGMHIECVTNVVPGWNDSEDSIRGIARWIVERLGPGTPWHITRFFPMAQLTDVPRTPLDTLDRSAHIAESEGLRFVYVGNAPTARQNTHCPKCGSVLIERSGYHTRVVGPDKEGRCLKDGTEVGVTI